MDILDRDNIANKLDLMMDIDEISKYLCNLAMQICKCDGCVINIWDSATNALRIASLKLPDRLTVMQKTYQEFCTNRDDVDPNITVFDTHKAAHFKNIDQIPPNSLTHMRFERWQMQELVILPINDDSDCAGTLLLFSCNHPIDSTQIEALQTCIDLFCQPLLNCTRLRDIHSNSEMIETLFDINDSFYDFLYTIPGNETLLNKNKLIAGYIINLFEFELGTFSIIKNNRMRLLPSTVSTDKTPWQQERFDKFYQRVQFKLELKEGANATSFIQRTTLYFPDVQRLLSLPMSKHDKDILEYIPNIKSIVYVPIIKGDSTYGTLSMFNFTENIDLPEHKIKILESLCNAACNTLYAEFIPKSKIKPYNDNL